MTRAEEKAWKAYPYVRGTKGLICENLRPVFIRGYEQAEKDLALTWEDIKNLDYLMNDVEFDNKRADTAGKDIPFNSDESFYGEILKRFKEKRNV